MEQELQKMLTNMEDAGCPAEAVRTAETVYRTGDTEALIRHLRKCRCGLMEELHESQRRVDRLDYLIRQTAKERTMAVR